LQLSVGKLQLPTPSFLTDEAAGNWCAMFQLRWSNVKHTAAHCRLWAGSFPVRYLFKTYC